MKNIFPSGVKGNAGDIITLGVVAAKILSEEEGAQLGERQSTGKSVPFPINGGSEVEMCETFLSQGKLYVEHNKKVKEFQDYRFRVGEDEQGLKIVIAEDVYTCSQFHHDRKYDSLAGTDYFQFVGKYIKTAIEQAKILEDAQKTKEHPELMNKKRCMEEIRLDEFDIMGIFELSDVEGIEELVTPIGNGRYFSRSGDYYDVKTYTELSRKREDLKQRLTQEPSKRNFVITESMLNASAKVYYEELQKKILGQSNHMEQAQECMQEDCDNTIRFMKGQSIVKPAKTFPEGEDVITGRSIQMDNKMLLYLYTTSLHFKKSRHVLIPGLGAIYIGPFLRNIHGFDYTNIVLSRYEKDQKLQNLLEKDLQELMSNDEWAATKNDLLLIDDNIATGRTVRSIAERLRQYGKDCRYGAIMYTWQTYYNVKKGIEDMETFDMKDVELLTIFDDPGYWISRDVGKALRQSADAYIEELKSYGYRIDGISDMQTTIDKAEKYTSECGIDLYGEDTRREFPRESSIDFCRVLREKVKLLISREN